MNQNRTNALPLTQHTSNDSDSGHSALTMSPSTLLASSEPFLRFSLSNTITKADSLILPTFTRLPPAPTPAAAHCVSLSLATPLEVLDLFPDYYQHSDSNNTEPLLWLKKDTNDIDGVFTLALNRGLRPRIELYARRDPLGPCDRAEEVWFSHHRIPRGSIRYPMQLRDDDSTLALAFSCPIICLGGVPLEDIDGRLPEWVDKVFNAFIRAVYERRMEALHENYEIGRGG